MDADPNDPDTRNSVVVGPHSRGARDSWHVTGGITRRAVVSGGLDAVVVTLEAHSANTRVQDQGFAALRVPTVDDVSRRCFCCSIRGRGSCCGGDRGSRGRC
jgi:hypothetical protein